MAAELLVLRIIHVVGGVFWVGTMLFNAFFLGPAMAAAGPAAGAIALQLQRRKLFTVLPVVAIVTLLAGARLMMITSNRFSPSYFSQRNGMTYGIAAIIAIIAFIYGMAVTRPAMAQVATLSQQAASDEVNRDRIMSEVRSMQQRARSATVVVAVLLLLTAIGMSVARYM
jgi:uncharacterized membrane protein